MSRKTTELDMTMMYAVHDALRRELMHIGKTAARQDDDPAKVLRSALGWEMFKKFLHIHHTAEDVNVWPMVRAASVGNADRLSLVDEMEAEHAKIDPLLAEIDGAVLDRNYGYQRFGDLIDSLVSDLGAHLKHEELDGLDLIDATMTLEQWKTFSDDHRERIGSDAKRYLPWLLDSADADLAEIILSRMPPQAVAAYNDEWGPSYKQLNLWANTD